MGKASRDKGKRGEREAAALLNAWTWSAIRDMDIEINRDEDTRFFTRNLNQSDDGGSDLSNEFNLAVEVKRTKKKQVPAWWRQTLQQAKDVKRIPVLMYRIDKDKEWTFITNHISAPDEMRVVPLDDFEQWFKSHIEKCLT